MIEFMLPVYAQATRTADTHEAGQIRFAERVIMNQFVRALSPSINQARKECGAACDETGALELAIGTIGISRSSVGDEALINLLGLRLDGAGSEELGCQILIRGRTLLHRMGHMKESEVAAHCQAEFMSLKKRELLKISDVPIEQVCRTEGEIKKSRDDFIKAIKSRTMCEQ